VASTSWSRPPPSAWGSTSRTSASSCTRRRGSLDSYYQEIGRGGRDGEPALAALFYRPEDLSLQRFFSSGRPDDRVISRVFQAVRHAGGPVRLTRLVQELDASRRTVTDAVNLL